MKAILFSSLALFVVMLIVDVACGKKTVILVGPTGVGKSTVGNCLINRSPALSFVQHFPFETSNDANSCTTSATMSFTDDLIVIDTAGFGDPTINSTSTFEVFREALQMCNNKVDLVLFVIQEGRITNELLQFVRIFQHKVFQGRVLKNSALICNKCNKGWLQANRRNNTHLNQLINNCNNVTFEFKLAFSNYPIQRENIRAILAKQCEEARRRAVDELVAFVDRFGENKVDLEYVQEKRFKDVFMSNIEPEIRDMNGRIVGTSKVLHTTARTLKFVVVPMASVISTIVMVGEGIPVLFAAGGGHFIYTLGRMLANSIHSIANNYEQIDQMRLDNANYN